MNGEKQIFQEEVGGIEFEIEDEGFEDGEGEQITLGVPSPENTLLTIFNSERSLHIVLGKDVETVEDPRSVIMAIIEEFSNLDHGNDWLESRGLSVEITENGN